MLPMQLNYLVEYCLNVLVNTAELELVSSVTTKSLQSEDVFGCPILQKHNLFVSSCYTVVAQR